MTLLMRSYMFRGDSKDYAIFRERMKILVIFLWFSYMFSGVVNASNVEEESLTSFYWSLNGPNWENNAGWLNFNTSYCNWFGITCDGNYHVSEIVLFSNNLKGTLPSNFDGLAWLQNLDLGLNSITGGLNALENLVSITSLDFSFNLINDTLPSFDRLTNLQVIDLYDNYVYGTVPSSIGRARNLWYISFSKNLIAGTLPPEMTDLNLTNIYLDNNWSLGGNVTHLFQEMEYLEWITMSHCQFSGPGPEFHPDAPLWSFDLSDNNFTGPIPDSWSKLRLLDELYISNNKFDSEIQKLLKLEKLRYILADNNQFTGSLPRNYNPNLSILSLRDNDFSGMIPNIHAGNGAIVIYDIRGNPGLKNVIGHVAGVTRFGNSVNLYYGNGTAMRGKPSQSDSFACHVIAYGQTLIFADPTFTDYEHCYCLFNDHQPPDC